MPTFNSATYAAQIGGNPRNRVDASVLSAEVRFAELAYAFTGTEAVGDILLFGQLQNGCIIYTELCALISEGIGGTTVTLTKVGDALVDNRYSNAALAATAAGYVPFVVIPANRSVPYVLADGGNVIQATLGGTLPATAGKRIWLKMAYRIS
jgi:hypothetical protein